MCTVACLSVCNCLSAAEFFLWARSSATFSNIFFSPACRFVQSALLQPERSDARSSQVSKMLSGTFKCLLHTSLSLSWGDKWLFFLWQASHRGCLWECGHPPFYTHGPASAAYIAPRKVYTVGRPAWDRTSVFVPSNLSIQKSGLKLYVKTIITIKCILSPIVTTVLSYIIIPLSWTSMSHYCSFLNTKSLWGQLFLVHIGSSFFISVYELWGQWTLNQGQWNCSF